jgi:endonuclease/exonuclease/phosphatase family metal-dependent hydrolase
MREWLLLAGLCASFLLVMLIAPEPRGSASKEPASRSFRVLRAVAGGLRLILLVAGALIALELAWYVGGRLVSPWNAAIMREDGGARPGAFSGTLKLGTYNICHLRGSDANQWPVRDRAAMEERRDAIVGILRAESPDIVVLQEIDFDSVQTGRRNQAEEIARLAGYPYRVEHRDVDAATLSRFSIRYGNAVLSRHPIVSVRNINFPASKAWEAILGGTPNGALCEIALSENLHINVLATHLTSHAEITRVASAKIIEKERLASKLPFFVVGDLNSTPTGFPNTRLANGENAMDILLAGGGYTTRPLNNPTPDDFTIKTAVIDWILVPADWHILSKNIVRSAASDHYALFLSAAP